jgi:hypothetical protein
MKAEHRRELESNVLVEKLGRAYQGLKQGPSRGTVLFVGAILLGVVLWFAWRYFSSTSAKTNSARWLRVDEAIFPEQLDGIVEDNELKGTTQQRVARYKEARRLLREGMTRLGGEDSATAAANIKRGVEIYEELLKESAPLLPLRQEALLGIAKGSEALNDLEKARSYYNQLANDKESAGSPLAKEAAKQVERLDDPSNERDLKDLGKKYAPKD